MTRIMVQIIRHHRNRGMPWWPGRRPGDSQSLLNGLLPSKKKQGYRAILPTNPFRNLRVKNIAGVFFQISEKCSGEILYEKLY